MTGISDTIFFMDQLNAMESDLKVKSFLEVWSEVHYHFAKTLLMVFCISHIIIITHPRATFDESYIHLFKALDAMRIDGDIDVSNDWLSNGRPCSPRVLFVFESSPLTDNSIHNVNENRAKPKKQSALKKLEHALEDQIYRILRKERIITNVSGNSLFAVPANQEFVYIFSSKNYITNFVDFYLSEIRNNCIMAKELDTTESKAKNKSNSSDFTNDSGFPFENFNSTNNSHSFTNFLFSHVNLALSKGFDDNVGRYPVPAYFEIATAHIWFEVAFHLSLILQDIKDSKFRSLNQTMKSTLDTDTCIKILPVASGHYQENLPTHYTEEYHQTRLAAALHVFNMNARGPAVQKYAKQLKEDCERLWKNGHQMCEVLSLTGNHCMNPIHRTDKDLPEDKSLPILAHCSQAVNYDFYVTKNSVVGFWKEVSFQYFKQALLNLTQHTFLPVSVPAENDAH
ncbi:protein smg8 [Caerostris extrusa]|uniref:Nonsense-mediated mRNA decay factor SMG8 n=1 Tax=Caerostris extrusa TaxID=172846 RepID=A0AAV4S091_CAEEX|nr:protein smg8 [Caerostris extrusa]